MFRALTKKITAKRGFTLMEILVVVGIIAVIAAISITGILNIRENLAFRQKNDYAKSIFMAAQTHLTELRAANGLEKLEKDPYYILDAYMDELDNPDTAKTEYADYYFTYNGHAAYNIVLPVGSVESVIREQDVIIEYNPKTGNVYAVFYSESSNPLYPQYTGQGLPRNDEGDEERRKEMMLGYYDGSDLSGAELGLMHMKADIRFENGEEGLVTVIVPTQDEKDTSFSIADDGNYNRYMSGLTVKLTVVGEQSGFFETVIKEAGSFDSSSCYPSIDPRTGAQVIHITFPIDSLKDNGSFADLASVTDNGSTTYLIQPGDNVSITAEVTYASSATDPIVEIEDAMVAGVNPMFHSLTTTSDSTGNTKYILTLSNGRNLQNLNLLHHDIAKDVESVLFVNPDGTITDVVIDWNDTVEYYNEKYGSGYTNSIYTNEPAEAPGRALPHFVPIMNETLLGTPAAASTCTINGNGVKIYDLNIDASKYIVPNGSTVTYENTGLFATANTSIDGISIVNPVIRGSSSGTPATGALVGELQLNGTVSNCGVYVDTEDIDFVRSKLNMSSFDGSDDQYGVSGSGAVGGLIGWAQTTQTTQNNVENSFAAVPVFGDVSDTDNGSVGGLVGQSDLITFNNCYASGYVGADMSTQNKGVGGFVGTSNGSQYTNCFASGNVSASQTGSAGFVGVMNYAAGMEGTGITQNTKFTNCYSVGQSKSNEDFCGYTGYGSTNTNYNYHLNQNDYVFRDSYYLSQNELSSTDRNSHSNKCASVASYDTLMDLVTQHQTTAWIDNELKSLHGSTYTPTSDDYTRYRAGFSDNHWGSAQILTTHAYDIALGNSKYPFTMLDDIDYYGNWPSRPLDAGIAYYETYDTNGDNIADQWGYYFDREDSSSLLPNATTQNAVVVSDGYMILAGNASDTVTVSVGTSSNSTSINKQPSSQLIPHEIKVNDTLTYGVFLLNDAIMSYPTSSDFYTNLTVTVRPSQSDSKSYTFYYNPNVALSHINPADGSTTAIAPGRAPSTIYIRTARQLAAVGENMASFWDENYIQQLDIDFNKYQGGTALIKAPIGNGTTEFDGSYIGRKDDGSVPKIIGYAPADGTSENKISSGIFGVIGESGVVRNLNLETGSSAISGSGDSTTSIGLLAGKNQGTIEKVNVTVNGNVTLNASATAGLLVGENSGKLINCQISQTAGTATLNAAHAGGLVGTVSKGSELEKVSVNLNKLSGNGILAGVFGKVGAEVTISDIPFLFIGNGANITSSGSAAGFVGESAGTIMDCSVRGKGTIEGTTSAAGFAVKVTGGTIDGCVVSPAEDFEDYKNKTNSNLTISGASAAGFVVTNNAVTTENKNDCIRSCTALGTVTGNSGNAAGFVITNSGTIEYCMSNVDMTAGTVFAKNNGGTVKECYGWSVSGTLDSAEDGSQHYLGSYFVLSSNGDVSLFDFKGKHANDTTASLSLINVLNKLTGGANSSVWDKRGSYEAYPYDITLTTEYPYPMLREHCGDWSIPVDAYAYGVVYYEKYSDGGWGVDLINLSDECPLNVNRSIRDAQNSVPNVAEAGYALFCKANTDPFSEETNQLIGEPIPANGTYWGLYQVAGLDEMNGNDCIYGLYRLNSSDFEVTVSNSFSTQSVELVPLFADTLTHKNSEDDKTDAPFRIRTQEHLENIKHLPAGKFVIDRCFSVDKSFSSIPTFSGELTGLDGAEVKATDIASGLIDKANGAVIDGVKLTATMSVKLEPASLNVIGTLVNEATDSTIANCTIWTDIKIYADEMYQDSITIGGIVGQMYGGSLGGDVRTGKDGSQIPNIHVTGQVTVNQSIANQLSCIVGGAVGLSAESANIFGEYENVSASVIIDGNFASSNANLSDPSSGKYISPYGSIGEFVGFVNGGYFTNCTATDINHPYEFFGGIQAVSKKVDNITHFQNASSGALTPVGNGTVEAVMVFHFDNATFEGCSGDKELPKFVAEKYFYNNSEDVAQKYERSESPIAATINKQELVSAAVLKEAANVNNGKTEYFIYDESDNAYYRITVHYEKEVVDSETGVTIATEVFTYSYTDQNGEIIEKNWPSTIEESGCDFLYKISFALDSSLKYVVFTADMNNAIILSDNGITYQSAPNDLSVNVNMICSGDANTLRVSGSYSTNIQIPDTYSDLSGFTMTDSNKQSITINGNDHFLVFEAHQVPDAISYKCVFTPAT